MLEPIDDVKAQVQINTNTMIQIKNMLDILMKESAEAMHRDEKMFKMIKETKEEVKKKTVSASSGFSYRPHKSRMVEEFVVTLEKTRSGQI